MNKFFDKKNLLLQIKINIFCEYQISKVFFLKKFITLINTDNIRKQFKLIQKCPFFSLLAFVEINYFLRI